MKLLVLPGDGIGEEITRATVQVLERADELLLAFGVADAELAPAIEQAWQRRMADDAPLERLYSLLLAELCGWLRKHPSAS